MLIWQVYPGFLSQVIYVASCEEFPKSIKCFDDDLKDGLLGFIFQRLSGTGRFFPFSLRHILSTPPVLHFSENLLLFSLLIIDIYMHT